MFFQLYLLIKAGILLILCFVDDLLFIQFFFEIICLPADLNLHVGLFIYDESYHCHENSELYQRKLRKRVDLD
jgi:hypothetical protein